LPLLSGSPDIDGSLFILVRCYGPWAIVSSRISDQRSGALHLVNSISPCPPLARSASTTCPQPLNKDFPRFLQVSPARFSFPHSQLVFRDRSRESSASSNILLCDSTSEGTIFLFLFVFFFSLPHPFLTAFRLGRQPIKYALGRRLYDSFFELRIRACRCQVLGPPFLTFSNFLLLPTTVSPWHIPSR